MTFCGSFLIDEELGMCLCGHLFDHATKHVLEQVLRLLFGQVCTLLALFINGYPDQINEVLALLLGVESNFFQLVLRDIAVHVLIPFELLLEDSSFQVDRIEHMLDYCLSIFGLLEDFVSSF